MNRFVEGTDRGQSTLFPECLEGWIEENNPVQVIDVFVDESLLPSLVCAYELELEWLDVVIVTGIFFAGEIALSRLLYALHVRARPY